MAKKGKVILDTARFNLTIERLCCQLIENWGDFSDACIVGIQPRGIALAQRIRDYLNDDPTVAPFHYGEMDITFYRDDFRRREGPLSPHPNNMEFTVTDKKVLLVDDVLYTGRTIQAALSALQHYGRPNSTELLVLVDRRFNRHIPIQADYIGIDVDALDEAYVKVDWGDDNNEQILLFDKKASVPT